MYLREEGGETEVSNGGGSRGFIYRRHVIPLSNVRVEIILVLIAVAAAPLCTLFIARNRHIRPLFVPLIHALQHIKQRSAANTINITITTWVVVAAAAAPAIHRGIIPLKRQRPTAARPVSNHIAPLRAVTRQMHCFSLPRLALRGSCVVCRRLGQLPAARWRTTGTLTPRARCTHLLLQREVTGVGERR